MKNFLKRLVFPILLILLVVGMSYGAYNYFVHPAQSNGNNRYYHPVIVTGQVTKNGNNVTRLFFNFTYTTLSTTYVFSPSSGQLVATNETYYSVQLFTPGVYVIGYTCGNGNSFSTGNGIDVPMGSLWSSDISHRVVIVMNLSISQCVPQTGRIT